MEWILGHNNTSEIGIQPFSQTSYYNNVCLDSLCHRRLKNPYVTALLICIISVSLIKIFFVNVEMTKAAAFNFLKRSWFADYLDKVRPKELKLKLPSCNS